MLTQEEIQMKKTSALIKEARQRLAKYRKSANGIDTSLIIRLADRLELILEQSPPDGWDAVGTHMDCGVMLEFSDELGGDGLPLWERPVTQK